MIDSGRLRCPLCRRNCAAGHLVESAPFNRTIEEFLNFAEKHGDVLRGLCLDVYRKSSRRGQSINMLSQKADVSLSTERHAEAIQREQLPFKSLSVCSQHQLQLMLYWCESCNVRCCSACVLQGMHQTHPTYLLEQILGIAYEQLSHLIQGAGLNTVLQFENLMEATFTDLLNRTPHRNNQQIAEEISEICEQVTDSIQRKKTELIQLLNDHPPLNRQSFDLATRSSFKQSPATEASTHVRVAEAEPSGIYWQK